MDLKIKNKRALVMGGSAGIGFSIAKILKEEGVEVAICARSKDKLEMASGELGVKSFECDLSKEGAGRRAVEKATELLGGVDILVSNTGGPPKGHFEDLSPTDWQAGFQNLWMSTVDSIQASLPQMREQSWGRILLVTSVAAKEPMSKLTISNGLRAGLHGLAKSISHEVAKFNITINSILPGYTATDRLKELGIPDEVMTSQIPMGRLGEPDEMGELAAFLASDRARYITGQFIAVDGGYLKGE